MHLKTKLSEKIQKTWNKHFSFYFSAILRAKNRFRILKYRDECFFYSRSWIRNLLRTLFNCFILCECVLLQSCFISVYNVKITVILYFALIWTSVCIINHRFDMKSKKNTNTIKTNEVQKNNKIYKYSNNYSKCIYLKGDSNVVGKSCLLQIDTNCLEYF